MLWYPVCEDKFHYTWTTQVSQFTRGVKQTSCFRLMTLSVANIVEGRWCGMALTGENREYSDMNLLQRHFDHRKSHTDWSRIELGPQQWKELNHTYMLLCIVIDFFWNNQTDAPIIQIYCYKTHVSGFVSARHQEFSIVHSALLSFMQVFDGRFQPESGPTANIKTGPTRRTNYPNLFCYKTLHVSGFFFARHQEFSTVHSAPVRFIQVLMTASKQSQDGTAFILL